MRMLGRIMPPLAVALAALAAAALAKALFSLSGVETALAASAVFCCLMVLVIYVAQAVSGSRIRKRLSTFSSYDSDIVRRLDQIERDHPDQKQFNRLGERLEELEDTMLGQLAVVSGTAGRQNKPVIERQQSAANSDRDWSIEFENENVVRLVTGKDASNDEKLAAKNHKQMQGEVLAALQEGTLRIKLQPVIDLLSRNIAFVEALPCLEIGGKEQPVRGLTEYLDARQRAEIDHFGVFELARVCRMMDEDGENARIFYRFLGPGFEDADHWQTLSRKLKNDRKLAARFIAVAGMEAMQGKSDKQLAPFFALAEERISLALGSASGIKQTSRQLATRRFSHLLAPADTLLSYLPGSNRRAGEEIVPASTRAGCDLIATDINERHQATGLLDLDVSYGMGDIISSPRSIRLYAKADAADGKASDNTA